MFRSLPIMEVGTVHYVTYTHNFTQNVTIYISSLDLISHGMYTLKSNNDMLCVVILTAHILLDFMMTWGNNTLQGMFL